MSHIENRSWHKINKSIAFVGLVPFKKPEEKLTDWSWMSINRFVNGWHNMFHNWFGNNGMCMDSWSTFRYDCIESVNWIGCVINAVNKKIIFSVKKSNFFLLKKNKNFVSYVLTLPSGSTNEYWPVK